MKNTTNKFRKTLLLGFILSSLLFSMGTNAQNKEIIGEWEINKVSFYGFTVTVEDLIAKKEKTLTGFKKRILKHEPTSAEMITNDNMYWFLIATHFAEGNYSFDGENYIKDLNYA